MKAHKKYVPYLFIAPAILILAFCALIPIFIAAGISFTDLSLLNLGQWAQVQFIGGGNYSELLHNADFQKAFGNTLYYVGIGVPLVILFSLVLALLLNTGKSPVYSVYRAAFYMPSLTNMVAISLVWLFLFNPSIGLFNQLLSLFSVEPVKWLVDPAVVKNSLLILSFWKNTGANMLIFLAALQGIPQEYYEAASIDGAGWLNRLLRITLPSMRFSFFFVITTTLIGWFQYFDEVFVMTKGGPMNSSISLALYIYQSGFQSNRLGYSAAASMILFLVIFVFTLLQLRLQRSGE